MANSYLTYTQSAGTSRRKFTYSVWMKRSSIDTSGNYNSGFFNCWSGANNRLGLYFYDNKLYLYGLSGGSANISVRTNRLFRDTSAWYHIVLAVDTTQGTAADRVKFYVNGVQETSLDQTTYPAQDHDLPTVGVNGENIEIGRVNFGDQSTYYYMDGYLSHVAFVDGTALTPTSFGETDSTSGTWKFKSPSGLSWGNNGFHLKMENSANLGLDSSGQTNNFTVSGNLKQALDTPSNVYATLNPLENHQQQGTYSNGNNTYQTNSSNFTYNLSTLGVSSGKWYWEVEYDAKSGGNDYPAIGITSTQPTNTNQELGHFVNDWGYYIDNGTSYYRNNNTNTSYGAAYAVGDIIGVALDLDNNKLYFSKNGTWQNSGVPTSGSTGTGAINITDPVSTPLGHYFAAVSYWDGTYNGTFSANFGNGFFGTTAITSAGSNGNGSLFEYDVPTGFYALNTKNINTYG